MDAEALAFMQFVVRLDPWEAIDLDEPLPDGLDLAALQELRAVVYALLHVLAFPLDEAAPIIGRLAELDRRIALAELLQSPKR